MNELHVNEQLHNISDDVVHHIREGRFQRSFAVMTALASLISGVEVAYEHYRGNYAQKVMYTPVALSAVLTGVALRGAYDSRTARGPLRLVSLVTLADAVIGFGFHVRGIARKPGGWRLPLTNIVMGPPIFSPLLFGTAAYLGLITSSLRTEDALPEHLRPSKDRGWSRFFPVATERARISDEQDLRESAFQAQLLCVTALSSALSGFEAWYSHDKSNFRMSAQYSPVIIAPALSLASLAGLRSQRVTRTLVPALSLLAFADAGVGFFFHVRGVLKRPGGVQYLGYNIVYGPPIFAPLLFGAAGLFGLLASLLRRGKP